ncbi:MAG: serine protease [Patescibacteria group bacterium UBA2163]
MQFPIKTLILGLILAFWAGLSLQIVIDHSSIPGYTPPPLIQGTYEDPVSSTPQEDTETVTEPPIRVEKPDNTVYADPETPQKPITSPTTQQFEVQPITNLTETVRSSVVNILCTTKNGGVLHPITASGVLIDTRGIVLTNAHVAQYFLLKDYPTEDNIECVIRTGSPAKPAYTAELLFLPPSWVSENAYQIKTERPRGTGEYDYAFLAITGLVAADILAPAQFSHLPVALHTPPLNSDVLLAGYPAGFLGGAIIQKDLYAVSSPSTVEQLYTFGTSTVDVISTGSSILAQQGASGGAVARVDGVLTGLIVTSSSADTTGERELHALTTEYIIRNFEAEHGTPLVDYLQGDLLEEKRIFEKHVAPLLLAQLVAVIEGN